MSGFTYPPRDSRGTARPPMPVREKRRNDAVRRRKGLALAAIAVHSISLAGAAASYAEHVDELVELADTRTECFVNLPFTLR